jgi:hypothetical protein
LHATDPLIQAFGEAAIRNLTLITDDEGYQTLFCLIMVSGALEEARSSLEQFDQQWWLTRCGQAAGRLNFDFELL